MVQLFLAHFLEQFDRIYTFSAGYPEAVLTAAILGYLFVRGKVKSALILIFGSALCLANYFVFVEYTSLTIPLIYAAAFTGISIFLLLLLVYQFIHTS
jgi:hypothetical protein